MPKLLKIRPHHFLCLSFYEGKGYNEKFVSNFDKLHKEVLSRKRKLLVGAPAKDSFCRACPHNNHKGCVEQSVQKLDERVKKILNLNNFEVLSWNKVQEKIKNNLTSKKLTETCKDCKWIDICKCKLEELLHN